MCHGIPNDTPLKDGDIVNLDVTIITPGGLVWRQQPHVRDRGRQDRRQAFVLGHLRGHVEYEDDIARLSREEESARNHKKTDEAEKLKKKLRL